MCLLILVAQLLSENSWRQSMRELLLLLKKKIKKHIEEKYIYMLKVMRVR